MRRLILIVIAAFAGLGSPAFAKEAGSAAWVVSQLSGDARVVHRGLQPVALTTAARLEPGDRVVTGLTGRATLTRGADYIILAPRSDLQLPATPEPAGFTRVIQNLGTMLFKVRHTGIPHFAVDTPMLAAVVKGTTFTVVVGPDRSAVQVIQGKVQVTAADGGMSRLVEGGKTVFIDRLEPKRLIDADQRSPGAGTASTTSALKVTGSATPTVASIASLTDGLVHSATTSTTSPTATPTPTVPDPVVKANQPVVAVVDATPPPATDTVTNVVDTTVPDVTVPATDVVGGVTDAVGGVTDVVGGVVDTTVPGVTDTVTDVVGGVTDVVGGVVDTTVPGVTDTVTDVVGGVTDTVTDVAGGVTDVIDTTVPGVVDTVTDVAGGVTDTATDLLDGVLGGSNSGSGSSNSGPGSDNSGSSSSGSGSSGSSGSDGGLLGGILGGLLPH